MPYALSRAECEQLRDQFAALSPALPQDGRDAEPRLGADGAFYRFPKDHWIHLRTTNHRPLNLSEKSGIPIEEFAEDEE